MIWRDLRYKVKPVLTKLGKGINGHNDPLTLDLDELTDSLNMCADSYPIARVRNDRALSSLPQISTSLYGIGQRNSSSIHVLDSNTWRYGAVNSTAWTNVSTAISSPGKANFIEFNTQTEKYTVLAHSTGTVYNNYWDGATLSTFTDTNAPRTNLYTAHKYRLYGVDNDGRTLRYSAQGDMTDFTTVDDAGYIDITEGIGKIIAISTYADHVVLWTNTSMHEVYGTGPDNYDLVNISYVVGCVGRNAYTECNGKLFWLDYAGIYMYTGGLPRRFAYKADKYIKGINWDYKHLISAGSVDNKIYFAIPYKSTAINTLIVIDLLEGKGNVHTINIEDGNWFGLQLVNEKLYGLRNDGYLYDLHSTYQTGLDNSTAISWSMETRPFSGEPDKKFAIREMWVEHAGTTAAAFKVAFTSNYESTTYTDLLATSDISNELITQRKQIIMSSTQLQNNYFSKFKIYGTGQKKISAIHMKLLSWGEEL